MVNPHESLSYVLLRSLADFCLFIFYILDHVVFFGRVKLITDMRPKLIAGFLCDWFWVLEVLFTVPADLVEVSMLKANLEKIKKGEVRFIVGH